MNKKLFIVFLIVLTIALKLFLRQYGKNSYYTASNKDIDNIILLIYEKLKNNDISGLKKILRGDTGFYEYLNEYFSEGFKINYSGYSDLGWNAFDANVQGKNGYPYGEIAIPIEKDLIKRDFFGNLYLTLREGADKGFSQKGLRGTYKNFRWGPVTYKIEKIVADIFIKNKQIVNNEVWTFVEIKAKYFLSIKYDSKKLFFPYFDKAKIIEPDNLKIVKTQMVIPASENMVVLNRKVKKDEKVVISLEYNTFLSNKLVSENALSLSTIADYFYDLSDLEVLLDIHNINEYLKNIIIPGFTGEINVNKNNILINGIMNQGLIVFSKNKLIKIKLKGLTIWKDPELYDFPDKKSMEEIIDKCVRLFGKDIPKRYKKFYVIKGRYSANSTKNLIFCRNNKILILESLKVEILKLIVDENYRGSYELGVLREIAEKLVPENSMKYQFDDKKLREILKKYKIDFQNHVNPTQFREKAKKLADKIREALKK